MHFIGRWTFDPDAQSDLSAPGRSRLTLEGETGLARHSVGGRNAFWTGQRFDEPGNLEPKPFANGYGVFSFMIEDTVASTLYAGADWLGFGPLYYAVDPRGAWISTSLTQIKCRLARKSIDFDAWDDIARFGHPIGDRTVVKEIKRLGAGQMLVLSPQGVRFETVWQPEDVGYSSSDLFVERNNALLIQAVERSLSLSGERVLPLTGGEDSRRLLSVLHHLGADFRLVTQIDFNEFGIDENTEVAQRLAAALGRSVAVGALPDADTYARDVDQRYDLLEWESGLHNWAPPLLREVRSPSLIYDGIAGGVLVNGHFARMNAAALEEYRDVERLSSHLLPEPALAIDDSLLEQSGFERVRDVLRTFPACPAALNYFFLTNRTRRSIGAWHRVMAMGGHTPVAPYLEREFFDYTVSIDPRALGGETYYQNLCVAALAPQLEGVPSTRGALPQEFQRDISVDARKLARLEWQQKISVRTLRRFHINPLTVAVRRLRGKGHHVLDFSRRLSRFVEWFEDDQTPVLVPEQKRAERDTNADVHAVSGQRT